MEKGQGKRTDTLQTDKVFARKEYTEREKVVELLNKWADGYSYIEVPTKDAIACVRAIPTADVVPVVRCKDCRKGIPDSEHATAYSCYGIWHKPDWFCAGGVRKNGDGDA